MATFVLVPGACHGAWWYQPVVRRLRQRGHDAYAITLTGVGDRAHLLSGGVNLETHVTDLVALLRDERLSDVVLVGHSYAGSVITVVADRLPESVRALVYLDAFVPADGDSCWSMTNDEQRRWYADGSRRLGYAVDPLPLFDDRATAHPLASLMQAARLTGAGGKVARRLYVAAAGWRDQSPFTPTADRLRTDPAWQVIDAATGHSFADLTADEWTGLVELGADRAESRP
jgi:pimeloyl-ACP methyl ester carboxylesterase